MADGLRGWPKVVVGNMARDTTNRPQKLRLKATTDTAPNTTIGGNGERKIKGNTAK